MWIRQNRITRYHQFNGQSSTVSKSSFSRPQSFKGSSFTIFVDNLPNSVGVPWFRNFFGNFGSVVESYLPFKKSRRTGNRFGFIRFDSSRSVDYAISKANGFWVGKRSLIVERASYDKGYDVGFDKSSNSNFVESGNFLRNHQYVKTPFHQKSDSNPYGSNKFLKNADKYFTLEVLPTASEWLTRSVVVKLLDITTTDMVQKAFSDMNFSNVLVRFMGGLDMIITFNSKDDRISALNNQVVKGWFKSIKPWNGETAGSSRLIWLKCRGMPLNAWGIQTFRKIGEIWGKFITLDQETMKDEAFDVGRMLITTDCDQTIDEWINIVVRGKNHRVRVWEEDCDDFFNEKSIRDWVNVHLPVKDGNLNLDSKAQSQGISNISKIHGDLKLSADGDDKGDINLVRKETSDVNSKVRDQTDMGNPEMEFSKENGKDEGVFPNNVVGNTKANGVPNINEVVDQSDSVNSSLGVENSILGNDMVLDSFGGLISVSQLPITSPNNLEAQETDSSNGLIIEDSTLQANSGEDVFKDRNDEIAGTAYEELESIDNEINEENQDHFEANHFPIQAAIKGIKRKSKRKSIDEILGYSKLGKGNIKGRRNKNKCVVLRSAVASAALSASLSSGNILNRNRILLDEAKAIWEVDKLFGISYDGDEDEVISKIAEMEAINKARAECHH